MRITRPDNMQALCQDLLQWRQTGLLRGESLRDFAREHFDGDLQAAEHFVTLEAIKLIASPTQEPPDLLPPG